MINKKIKKIDVRKSVIKILIISFLFWYKRCIAINTNTEKKMYVAGTCLLKKAKKRKTGTNDQYKILFFLNAKIKKIIATKDNKAEWWSTNGVPLDG